MKITLLLICFQILTFEITAQTSLTLSGIVCDKTGGLPYSTISVWRGNDSINASHGIADNNGNFHIYNLKSGTYKGIARFIGYETKRFNLEIHGDKKMDTIFLNPDIQTLAEVEVIARKVFEDKMDKLRMNVGELRLPQGATSVDVLQEIPGSFYNVSDNTLKILNKDILVLLDGRPVRMPSDKVINMLAGQKAEDVGNIEIMYDTPVRFRGEWDGPVVNIITKKNLESGLYGSVSATLTQRRNLGDEIYLNLNYRTRKTNTYLILDQGYSPREYGYDIYQYNNDGDTLLRQKSRQKENVMKYMIMTGTGITINKNNSFDFNYKGFLSNENNDISDDIVDRMNSINSIDSVTSENQRHDLNLYYKHNFNNQNHFISIEGNYIYNDNKNRNDRRYSYINDSVAFNRDEAPFSASLYMIRSDYYHEWSDFMLEAGAMFQKSVVSNDFIYQNYIESSWIDDIRLSNDFDYRENNYIAYAKFSHQINKKINYSLSINNIYVQTSGHSETIGQTDEKDYNCFRPNVTLRYKPHDAHFFTLKYYRNLVKPDFATLNPFRKYENPTYFIEGNPNLTYSLKNTFELAYRFRYWLNLSVSYYNQSDQVVQIPQFDSENAIIGYTYGNFGRSDNMDIRLNISQKYFDNRLRMSLFGNVKYADFKSENSLAYNNSLWNYYASLNFNYLIYKKYDFRFSGYASYISSRLEDYGKVLGNPKVGLTLSAKFLKGNLFTSLGINDLFNSEKTSMESYLNGVFYEKEDIPDSRYIRLSLQYNFNRKSLKRYNNHQGYDSESIRM